MVANNNGPRPWPTQADIFELEVDQIDVRTDAAFNGVQLELVNPGGGGIRTLLDWTVALDLAMRLIGATARLRGYGVPGAD